MANVSKANSLAIERMKEKDEMDRLERINTKQKLGTPVVSSYIEVSMAIRMRNSIL